MVPLDTQWPFPHYGKDSDADGSRDRRTFELGEHRLWPNLTVHLLIIKQKEETQCFSRLKDAKCSIDTSAFIEGHDVDPLIECVVGASLANGEGTRKSTNAKAKLRARCLQPGHIVALCHAGFEEHHSSHLPIFGLLPESSWEEATPLLKKYECIVECKFEDEDDCPRRGVGIMGWDTTYLLGHNLRTSISGTRNPDEEEVDSELFQSFRAATAKLVNPACKDESRQPLFHLLHEARTTLFNPFGVHASDSGYSTVIFEMATSETPRPLSFPSADFVVPGMVYHTSGRLHRNNDDPETDCDSYGIFMCLPLGTYYRIPARPSCAFAHPLFATQAVYKTLDAEKEKRYNVYVHGARWINDVPCQSSSDCPRSFLLDVDEISYAALPELLKRHASSHAEAEHLQDARHHRFWHSMMNLVEYADIPCVRDSFEYSCAQQRLVESASTIIDQVVCQTWRGKGASDDWMSRALYWDARFVAATDRLWSEVKKMPIQWPTNHRSFWPYRAEPDESLRQFRDFAYYTFVRLFIRVVNHCTEFYEDEKWEEEVGNLYEELYEQREGESSALLQRSMAVEMCRLHYSTLVGIVDLFHSPDESAFRFLPSKIRFPGSAQELRDEFSEEKLHTLPLENVELENLAQLENRPQKLE